MSGDAAAGGTLSSDVPGAEVPGEEDEFVVPASYAQQSMWLENELDPGQATYHVVAALRLLGDLDRAALERALNTVVERHEVLRTVFELDEDGPVQVIRPCAPLAVPLTDIAEAGLDAAVQAELATPFDLDKGPLLRLSLLRLEPGSHIAVLVMHHIVTDGVSSAIFVAELAACYEAYCEDREPELPELGIQYADFAVWQREILRGDKLDRLAGHWRAQLEGAPPLRLLTDRAAPGVPSGEGDTHVFALPAALTSQVETLARAERVTSFMVFLAAFDVLLSRWSGQRDITVASPMAGRVRPELENLIGFFVNPLLLRTDLGDQPTGRELVRRVQDTCAAAYEHQEFPFEMASEILRTARGDAPGTPQAQAMLVLQNMAPAELRAGGLVIEPLRVDTRTAGFALALDLEADGAGGYRAWLEYSVELFTAETAAAMAEQFTAILGEMAASPDAPISVTPVREPMPEVAADMPSVATAVPADEPAVEPPYRAPQTPLETELHAVFCELLGADDIGVNEDFFALGGDSLSLIQLRNRVREQYGVEFPVRELFPTVDIEGLAWRILSRMLEDEDASPGTGGGQAREDEEPGQRPGADKEQQS